MKKKLTKILAVVLVSITICAAFSLSLVSYSQSSDPLVTLSYLTEIILPQLKTDVLAEVQKNSGTQQAVDDEADKTNAYTLVELTLGECIYAESPLEIIVRPGSDVRAISPFPEQGIADISKNKEYLNGDSLDVNTYCLIPRGGDGRGIEVFNEKSYILVRGEFYIG